jgi:hypothetical protein
MDEHHITASDKTRRETKKKRTVKRHSRPSYYNNLFERESRRYDPYREEQLYDIKFIERDLEKMLDLYHHEDWKKIYAEFDALKTDEQKRKYVTAKRYFLLTKYSVSPFNAGWAGTWSSLSTQLAKDYFLGKKESFLWGRIRSRMIPLNRARKAKKEARQKIRGITTTEGETDEQILLEEYASYEDFSAARIVRALIKTEGDVKAAARLVFFQ